MKLIFAKTSGVEVPEHRLQTRQNSRCRFEKRLTGLHNIQVEVGRDFKRLEHLIQHFPVLRGNADLDVEMGGMFSKTSNNGTELDRFRPRAEDQ